ncbi:LysR family transcriptional regulator [Pseudovibrio sp. SCP19]|uniref:LysR family transcriptional regulator n=1 Tax=Pseudovibrio sp. SCP19 TaxID=3141374 RepID=UPI00333C6B16
MALVDWEMLPYFLAVARAGSLRAGADLLNANHVTVDRGIKSLEASYGVQLFTRTSRGFEVTDAGEELLPVAEEIEKLITTARHRVEGLDKTEAGTIRFSLPPVLAHDIIAPIIAKFSSTYPEINVELRLTDAQESISRSETDISLRVAYEIDEDTIARKLYPMAIGTFASKEYLKANMPDAGTGGSGLNWIGWTGPGSSPGWVSQSPFPYASLRHSSGDGLMLLSMVRQGCGMSNMPVYFANVYPELEQVPGTEPQLAYYLWILLHSDLRRTVRVRRFVDFLAEELKALQPLMQGSLYRP